MQSHDETDALAAISAALDELGVRWYLMGAQAAILYGLQRFTADVDVTVELEGRETSELVGALRACGIQPRIDDEQFIRTTRVIPCIHTESRTPIDIVLAGPGLEDYFFEGAREVNLGALNVRVAAVEDLIVMKILAARPKDLDDVAVLIAIHHDSLNESRIHDLLALLEQALDQSDLLATFRDCKALAKRARQAP